MLEGPGGPSIRHYMFDFGSIMGSGSTFPQVPRAGNEYILEWAPALKTLATLRPVRPALDTRGLPARSRRRSAGSKADFFDPVLWRPGVSEPRVRQHAAGRCVLGGTARRQVLRRGDQGDRGEGAVQRSRRGRVHRRDAHQTT